MARPKKAVANTEEKRAKVMALHRQGLSLRAIGQQVGQSHVTVWEDLKLAYGRWRKESSDDLKAKLESELATLDLVESEAREQWDRSKLAGETRQTRITDDGTETVETVKGQCGDPRYLSQIQDCIDKRSKLLGLYAPTKHAETDGNGNDLTPAQRDARLVETLAVLRKRAGEVGALSGNGKASNGHAGANGNGHE